MKNIDSIKVRMYRHGFGDCFLLQFFAGATRNFTMLIDCGLKLNDHVEGITLEDVRDDILKELKGSRKTVPQLDVLVATHEHWDHVSGFHPDKKLFDKLPIGKLWLAWTENPEDKDAKVLNKGLRKRVKALKIAAEHLKKKTDENAAAFKMQIGGDNMLIQRKAFNNSLDGLLDFFGPLALTTTPGGIKVSDQFKISLDTQNAMDHLRILAKKGEAGIVYLDPGQLIEEKTKLPGIRMYVMGPPKNKLLNKAAPSGGAKKEVYFGDSSLAGFVEGVFGMDAQDPSLDGGRPFGTATTIPLAEAEQLDYIKDSYFDPKQSYRRIDDDWLDMAGALAMQMDADTNNTSLVLAIEFVDSRRVLLFPGDAQVGNWLSWHEHEWDVKNDGKKEIVNAEQLLNNTVFYKVGHHCSHNATLKEKGLEMMTHEDLVAFVPEKEHQYKGIPHTPLLNTLLEKTKGRTVVSADVNFPAGNVLKKKPKGLSREEWARFKEQLTITDLFVEYIVK
jgi:beta-lactamase superfamily II metal-dependent hydrolase